MNPAPLTAWFVIPEAPPQTPAAAADPTPPVLRRSGPVRLGLLDNNKANAGELLALIEERVRREIPLAGVVRLRKTATGMPASPAIMEQLLAQTDCVVMATAD